MLRPDLVHRKLQLISEDLHRLVLFKDLSLAELTSDFIKQATVERLLERIVMRAIDVNEHLISELATGEELRTTRLGYRDTFLKLTELGVYSADFAERIAQSVGLRNILVHDYNDVDHTILHGAISHCLRDYLHYVESVNAFVAQDQSGVE